MNRKTKNKKDFFIKDSSPNRKIISSLSELEKNMRDQYTQKQPHINMKQINESPSIEIVSRSDNNESESKITIHKK